MKIKLSPVEILMNKLHDIRTNKKLKLFEKLELEACTLKIALDKARNCAIDDIEDICHNSEGDLDYVLYNLKGLKNV